MSDPRIHATETELWVDSTIAGTPEMAALDAWSAHFGFEASKVPICGSIVRDVERRRIYYTVFDLDKRGTSMDVSDYVREEFVQLESPPPPWPREVDPPCRPPGRPTPDTRTDRGELT